MLHHVSFSARDPQRVAYGVAKLLDGVALQAPCPPFPLGSWFVCLGDAMGTMLEVLPWGHVQGKESGGPKHFDEFMRERSSTHFLLQTPRTTTQIKTIADELDWECTDVSTGLFDLTRVWVEGSFLIEFMTVEQAKTYVMNFGAEGIATLDGKLRQLEQALQKKAPAP